MDSVHHIWCPLSSQEFQDLPDGAETTLTNELITRTQKFTINRSFFQTDDRVLRRMKDVNVTCDSLNPCCR
ncbi:hypothetical protein DNK70_28240 [Klebsiella pneumoniae]|nr:hypothetical protein DNK70_28240 [Klebsiella pneumoniae]